MIEVRLKSPAVEVDFQASAGITALFGPAGAGKTFILDAIAGFATPESGRVMVNDGILFDAASGVNLPARRRRCGYIGREWALFPHMSLRDNLQFPLAGITRLERHRRVSEMMERFALKESAGRLPKEVAPAERLRCTVARALIAEPRILLVDEPACGLHALLRQDWHAALRLVWDETNVPVLLATRDLETCFELAAQMFLLANGRVLQAGSPQRVLDQPASADAARLLGFRNMFPAEIVALDPGRNTSRLRLDNFELAGPYFPGRLRGDRVWLCVLPGELRATPHDGSKAQPNQVSARLERATDMPRAVRLEFAGGLVAEVPRDDFARQKDNKEWLVEFPPHALRVL